MQTPARECKKKPTTGKVGTDMKASECIERLLQDRRVRLAVAGVLLAAGFWAFGPYLGSRVGSSAFINAPLVRVTSPIAGRLTENLPSRGQYLPEIRSVNLVQALAPDQRHLFDLRQQSAVAERHAELARAQLKEIAAADIELRQRLTAYRTGMAERISQELEETVASSKGCEAEAQLRREVGSQMEHLTKLGLVTQVRTADALVSRQATNTRCEMSASQIKRLEIELASAQNGVFLRDGANDVPYSQQQRDRLVLRRQELETEALNETSKLEQLTAAIAEESDRLLRADKFELTLPAGYVVWATGASPGATVIEGQFVTDLADCSHRFVTVELPERDFENVTTGDRAAVRLVGSRAWTYGIIRGARGSAARADDRLLAAAVPKPSSGSITVDVELPAAIWADDRKSNFCDVGRLAEVRFSRLPPQVPSFVRRAWRAVMGGSSPASVAAAGDQNGY
jgi:multidrug resistance efflux pump